MKRLGAVLLLFVSFCACAQDVSSLKWQKGPGTGIIDGRASIVIPDGYVFLDAEETKKYEEMSHNLSNGSEYLFAPTSGGWEAYFLFNEEGYIKDSDKLDADALLKSNRELQEQANIERKQKGWPAFEIVGWRVPPRYNPKTKVLEWALIIKEEGSAKTTINYNTRVLGRKGTMGIVVVSAPEDFSAALVAFQSRLNDFKFNEGDRYADYRPGDHVAEYGLAALVAGGAAAVVAKKGFFTVIAGFLAAAWKFILAGLAALGARFKGAFRKKSP